MCLNSSRSNATRPCSRSVILGGVHLGAHERMAADRALAEDDQVAREDVRAFDRDRDRHGLVVAGHVILRAEHDRFAAVHVHCVVRDQPAELGVVVLQDRRRHRGLLAVRDRGDGDARRGRHRVDVPRHPRERLADAVELADRQTELAAQSRVRARRVHRGHRGAERVARQHDAAADGELLHEHPPALARHFRAADDRVERHEHVAAARGAVLERNVDREVSAPDLDAGQLHRDQRGRDPVVVDLADQMLGVIKLEREAKHCRDRRERDVALVPVELDADDLGALVDAPRDDAVVDDRRRVGADPRRGQREAWHLVARREAGQPILLLLLGAVVQQELGRSERVRHADRRRGGGVSRRHLHEHHRACERREAESAVARGDDHCEELLVLQELPDLGRHVEQLVGDLPVVEHSAELLDRPVEERLLLRRELRRGQAQQLAPIG